MINFKRNNSAYQKKFNGCTKNKNIWTQTFICHQFEPYGLPNKHFSLLNICQKQELQKLAETMRCCCCWLKMGAADDFWNFVDARPSCFVFARRGGSEYKCRAIPRTLHDHRFNHFLDGLYVSILVPRHLKSHAKANSKCQGAVFRECITIVGLPRSSFGWPCSGTTM